MATKLRNPNKHNTQPDAPPKKRTQTHCSNLPEFCRYQWLRLPKVTYGPSSYHEVAHRRIGDDYERASFSYVFVKVDHILINHADTSG